MLTTVRRSLAVDSPVDLVTCVVCLGSFPPARGHMVCYLGQRFEVGCLACLASFRSDPGRHPTRACPDCDADDSPDSPVSEWACY